jgi:hypothetical protein
MERPGTISSLCNLPPTCISPLLVLPVAPSLSKEGEERDNGCDGPRPRCGESCGGAHDRRGCTGEVVEHSVLLQRPTCRRGGDEDEEHDGEEGGGELVREGHGDRRS